MGKRGSNKPRPSKRLTRPGASNPRAQARRAAAVAGQVGVGVVAVPAALVATLIRVTPLYQLMRFLKEVDATVTHAAHTGGVPAADSLVADKIPYFKTLLERVGARMQAQQLAQKAEAKRKEMDEEQDPNRRADRRQELEALEEQASSMASVHKISTGAAIRQGASLPVVAAARLARLVVTSAPSLMNRLINGPMPELSQPGTGAFALHRINTIGEAALKIPSRLTVDVGGDPKLRAKDLNRYESGIQKLHASLYEELYKSYDKPVNSLSEAKERFRSMQQKINKLRQNDGRDLSQKLDRFVPVNDEDTTESKNRLNAWKKGAKDEWMAGLDKHEKRIEKLDNMFERCNQKDEEDQKKGQRNYHFQQMMCLMASVSRFYANGSLTDEELDAFYDIDVDTDPNNENSLESFRKNIMRPCAMIEHGTDKARVFGFGGIWTVSHQGTTTTIQIAIPFRGNRPEALLEAIKKQMLTRKACGEMRLIVRVWPADGFLEKEMSYGKKHRSLLCSKIAEFARLHGIELIADPNQENDEFNVIRAPGQRGFNSANYTGGKEALEHQEAQTNHRSLASKAQWLQEKRTAAVREKFAAASTVTDQDRDHWANITIEEIQSLVSAVQETVKTYEQISDHSEQTGVNPTLQRDRLLELKENAIHDLREQRSALRTLESGALTTAGHGQDTRDKVLDALNRAINDVKRLRPGDEPTRAPEPGPQRGPGGGIRAR